jgi:hypothetical protein
MTIQQEIHKLTEEIFMRGDDKKLQVVAYLGNDEWREFYQSLEPWFLGCIRDEALIGKPMQFNGAMIMRVVANSYRHITTIPKP